MKSKRAKIKAWGNYPVVDGTIHSPTSKADIENWLGQTKSFIPAGNFRSYGDAALAEEVLWMRDFETTIQLNPSTGLLQVSAGVLLAEILDAIVTEGWFLPVTPGTKYITIGGAVAADIHGKNHHVDGCISNFVASFDLLKTDGTVVRCSNNQNADLFWATCGGMGLTGVILHVQLQLIPISSSYILKKTVATNNLNETIQALEATEADKYSVAWFDAVAKGSQLGRGIVYSGRHATAEELPAKLKRQPLHYSASQPFVVPFYFPGFALNPMSIKAFNWAYYGANKRKAGESFEPINPFFYPLDKIRKWNRIYGRKGFLQYQCVIPRLQAAEGIRALMEEIRAQKGGSFLAVLKIMGPGQERSPLHFPLEGLTLALDFSWNKDLLSFFRKLDAIVLKYGGRIYLAKDAALDRETFEACYPKAEAFGASYVREGAIESLQWKRLQE
ncbi:MAG: FAD-binding oxidoreductase [Bacteroidota bacterium]